MTTAIEASAETSQSGEPGRARPLSATLLLARGAARAAGVTRLADVSGLTPFGVPVFQAVRPGARSLSVSQGKGLTRQAAQVSALLEAAELAVAERVPEPAGRRPLAALGADVRAVWAEAPRDAHAIRLDPAHPRGWLPARCLGSGRALPVPWDLLHLDYTRPPAPDALASSSGLATGNTPAEAMACAVAELLERDLSALFHAGSARERRGCEVDAASVDDPALAPVLARIARAGFDVRLWSVGDPAGIAALRCALVPCGARPVLPPTLGSGCHASRAVATRRAVLEAVQVHATLVAGARDDLEPGDYHDPAGRRLDLLFGTLALARADRAWATIPDAPCPTAEAALDRLVAAAGRRTALPVVGLMHDSLVPGLHVARALAPGLCDPARRPHGEAAAVRVTLPARVRPARRPVLFVGPTLPPGDVPPAIEARPPAVAGDLAALLADPPPAVGLVDGCFETGPSVWHKEILHLLALGVPVLGAASLGALRAAELDALGMRGIGCIYAAYRDGHVRRDDAVMLPHAPAEFGWRPLGVALVDMEAALAGVAMPARVRRGLLRAARRLHYSERTWARCLQAYAAATGQAAPVRAETLAARPSLKRADALALARALEEYAPGSSSVTPDRVRGDGSGRASPLLTSPYRRLLARVIPAPR